MYGDLANKLIFEAKRISKLSHIPTYQNDLIKDIIKEILDLNKDAEYLIENQQLQEENNNKLNENEEEQKINQCQLFVIHLSMRRNKRCLLAYEKLRANKINEFIWLNKDPIINDNINNNSDNNNNNNNKELNKLNELAELNYLKNYTTQLILNNLNYYEQEYFKNYQNLLINYKSNFSNIDLSGDLEPPKNIFIDVRVLKDGGEIQTEYGVFNLIRGSQFYVRKSDVERLIQQGYLEEI